VVIEVNARSDPSNNLGKQPDTPGVISMVNAVISNPIDAATAGSSTQLRTLLSELRDAAGNAPPDALLGGTHIYDIDVDFDQFLPSQTALRDQVKNIPTSWSISTTDIAALDQAAQLLLHQHPCFQALLFDVHDPGGSPSDACPQPAPAAPRAAQRVAARAPAR